MGIPGYGGRRRCRGVPELAITGYPPEDLVLRPSFVDDNLAALDALAANTAGGCAIVVGFVDRTERGIHNAAAVLGNGEVIARYHKIKLPNYGVFDEARTFTPGEAACPIRLGDAELGLSVCEDAWMPVRRSTSTPGGRLRSSSTQRVAVPPRQGRRACRDLQGTRARDRLGSCT